MQGCIDHETLSRYQDGALPADAVARFEEHLASCDACRRRVVAIGRLARHLGAAATLDDHRHGMASAAPCPDAIDLARLADGALDEASRSTIIGHVARCPDCSAAVAALGRELAGAALEPLEVPGWARERACALVTAPAAAGRAHTAPGVDGGDWRTRLGGWLEPLRRLPVTSLGAAAMVALILVVFVPVGRDGGTGVLRGRTDRVAPELLVPTAAATVRADAVELRWQPFTAASSYRVTVVDASGGFFWESSTAGTRLAVPEATAWTTDQVYRWWVTALLDSGRQVTSETESFRLVAPRAER